MQTTISFRYRLLAVLIVTLATVSFHYGWIIKPSHDPSGLFHAIHGRLCYIPIILGAIWFGARGGVLTALLIVALTFPYTIVGSFNHQGAVIGEYTEMVFYIGIGLMAGILIELQRRQRKRSDDLSRELVRQEHLSSLGRMAAGLAHEIKNPLGSIKGSTELLGDDFPPGSKKADLLAVLSKETNRLDRVVEDFLNFARPRPLRRSSTQVSGILDDVIRQIKVDDRASGVQFVTEYDAKIPRGNFDSEKLHQVFLNVIINAVTAMPDGGKLTIRTSQRFVDGRREIVVSFIDEGVGIDRPDIDRIFDPFFTTSEQGTGLGLSISHMIVQHHGGRVEVTPGEGKGTRVSIILPIDEAH